MQAVHRFALRFKVVTAGVLLGLAWVAQILISLYQLWFLRVPEEKFSLY